MLESQPTAGQRILMKFIDGKVRIGDYSAYDYRQWGVGFWKPIPDCMDKTNG